MVISRTFEVVSSSFGIRWGFVQVQKTKRWTTALLLALWESFVSWQLTWFQMCLAKKCKEALRRSTSIMIANQRRCWSCWSQWQPFRGEFAGCELLDVSDEWRKIKTRHSMCWFGPPAQDRDFSVSSEVVEMSSHQASARFNHNTVINVCVLEELALWALPLHRRAFEAECVALDKNFQIEHHRWPEKKKKLVLRKKRKEYEEKQVEKEGVSHEPGGFSTRFVFGVLYCTLKIEFPELHQGLCSWITWLYRSRYPTSMTCVESCSHLIGKLEVHALHYPPLVRMAPVIVENARKSRTWQWASGHIRSRSEECIWRVLGG